MPRKIAPAKAFVPYLFFAVFLLYCTTSVCSLKVVSNGDSIRVVSSSASVKTDFLHNTSQLTLDYSYSVIESTEFNEHIRLVIPTIDDLFPTRLQGACFFANTFYVFTTCLAP